MKQLYYLSPKALFAIAFYYLVLQEQLIEAQQEVIDLQKQVDEMRPKEPADNEVFWHIASDGIMSHEAATSDDLALVKKFRDWNIEFAKKYIKPHVSQKVYGECLNQMTRGLSEQIAKLETDGKPKLKKESPKKIKAIKPPSDDEKSSQMVLIH